MRYFYFEMRFHGQWVDVGKVESTLAEVEAAFGHCAEINSENGLVRIFARP